MAEITNKLGLPEVLVRALQRDPYSRGNSRYSITQLIDAPKVRVLKQRHHEEVQRDISDSVWMLLGKGVHHILEHGAAEEGDLDHTIEERIFVKVMNVVVSGQMDVQRHPDATAEIIDWKVTSVFRVMSPDGMKKWEEQLNGYRAIRHLAKLEVERNANPVAGTKKQVAERDYPGEVKHLTIVAFLRDWSKSKARQNPEYPQAPVVRIVLPVWPIADALSWLEGRVKLHLAADNAVDIGMDPDDCTDDERWKRKGTFEVVQITKDGREWIRGSFSGDGAEEAANAKMEENKKAMKTPAKTWVREKEALPIRCMDWCEVADFCAQWQREKPKDK